MGALATGCPSDPPDAADTSTTGSTTESVTSTTNGTPDPTTTTVDPDSTTATPETGSSDTDTPTGCDADNGSFDPRCPSDAPFCVDATCTPCIDPITPDCTAEAGGLVCDPSGACVECSTLDASACSGNTPVCQDDNTCGPCTAHEQCPGGAGCHLFEGSCLPEDPVLDIVPAELPTAIDMIGPDGVGTIRVTAGSYLGGGLVIPSGAVIAIIGDGTVNVVADDGLPVMQVDPDSTAYLDQLILTNLPETAPGIESSGDVRLDRCTVQTSTTGVLSTEGRVHLERTRVINNVGVGVDVGGSDPVVLRNVILAGNGAGGLPQGFVTSGPTPFTITYSTIAENAGNAGGAITSPAGTGEVRNSIIVSTNLADSVSGSDVSVTNCAVADDGLAGADGNIAIPAYEDLGLDMSWELSGMTIVADVAIWADGDPAVDINGSARPTMDGAPDYAGADRPD